jgi:hypothetical protein
VASENLRKDKEGKSVIFGNTGKGKRRRRIAHQCCSASRWRCLDRTATTLSGLMHMSKSGEKDATGVRESEVALPVSRGN